jgi:hypothetical protein
MWTSEEQRRPAKIAVEHKCVQSDQNYISVIKFAFEYEQCTPMNDYFCGADLCSATRLKEKRWDVPYTEAARVSLESYLQTMTRQGQEVEPPNRRRV